MSGEALWEAFQRDEPGDPIEARARIAALGVEAARAREVGDQPALVRALGRRGDLLRVLGDGGAAVDDLREAVRLARRLGDEGGVRANRIRLATARFYAGHHPLAEAELRATIEDIEQSGSAAYLDLAHQHLGKCLAEQGRFSEAADSFRAALRMRAADEALARSSRAALDEAERRAGTSGRS